MSNLLFLLAACADQASFNPTADAGFDQQVSVGGTATLDGSGSYDQDGSIASYQWSLLAAPEGSSAATPAAGESTSFVADVAGPYTLALVVMDDEGNESSPDVLTVTATAGNGRPDAVLSTSSSIQVGSPILLDGSASTDPEGDALSYIFSVQVAPSDSAAAITHGGDSDPAAEFIPDQEGVYVLGLEVDDGTSRSTRADLTIKVTSEGNQPPVADCGPAQAVDVGVRVQLNGGGSFDPEGSPLTYAWTLSAPEGSGASLNDQSAIDPSFEADVEGAFRAELVVSDGALTGSCTVRVNAGDVAENLPPTASAGPDAAAKIGDTIDLDGSGSSDPEGEPLDVSWQFVSQPTGSALSNGDIQNSSSLAASFRPDKAGTWLVQIAVCDSEPLCDTDTVQFEVEGEPGNNAPSADAGADQSGNVGDTLTADASASSDPDGDALSFTWTLDSAPSGSVRTTGDIAAASSDAPRLNLDVSGRYVLSVEVCDPSSACDTDTMTMSAAGAVNTAPVSDAGADQTVTLGDTVSVDGSGSSDPDGDPLTYFWGFNSVPSGSAIKGSSYADRAAVSTSFVPDVEGTYTVKLRVDDGTDFTNDTMTLTVEPGSTNTVPVADAGADQDQCGPGDISLDGSGSTDADGDALTYAWVFISVPSGSALVNADITDRKTDAASFTPDAEGSYSLRLFATDPSGDSDTDRVDIEVGDDGTVLVLHMDESSGTTVTDSSWGGNDGTAVNGDWVGARVLGGMDFDSEFIDVPYTADLALTSDWSIEWWMKPDGQGSGFEAVFMKEDAGGTSYEMATFLNGTQMYLYGLTAGGSYLYLIGNPTLDGEWHHYVITYDSSFAGVMYEDGVSIATATGGGAVSNSGGDFVIGEYSPYPGYYEFNGRMDEFIIHESALSSSEVSSRYSSTTQFCTGDEDTTAPSATITSPSSGTTSTAGVVAIEGTASDESEITTLTVGGSNAVPTSDNYATWVAYVSLADGSNTIDVDGEDIVGNTGTTLDTTTVTYSDTCYDDYALFLSWDEDSGATASDYSDNALDATESATDRVIGAYGNAGVFDGSSAYATITHDAALSYSGNFTADFWFRRDGATTDIEVLFHKGTYNYAAALDGSDLYCLVRDSSSTDWTTTATGYNDGDWHHVVCNYTGTKLRMYVDGVFEDIATVGGALSTNSDDFYVGSANGSAYFFQGELDELRIREDTYTGAELKALYTEGEVCTISDNLAPDGTATATTSLSANYTASNVIDEQVDEDDYADETYWLLRTGTTGYVTIELADYVGVTRIRWVNTTHGPRYSYATKAYEIYGSYNGEFAGEEELMASGTGDLETVLRYHQEDLAAPVAAKYVRFYVDSYYSTGGGVNEIEVFGLE